MKFLALLLFLIGSVLVAAPADNVIKPKAAGGKIVMSAALAYNTANTCTTIDGSKNIYYCEQSGGATTLTLSMNEGQQLSWSIKNTAGSGALTITFPSGLLWRDGTVFDTVDFGETNIYTFFKINGQIAVACMTDLK